MQTLCPETFSICSFLGTSELQNVAGYERIAPPTASFHGGHQ